MRTTAMTEPKVTKDCSVYLQSKLPMPLDVTKHVPSEFNPGIPDMSVAWNGYTSWLEFKMLKPGKSLESEIGDHQLIYCRRLEGATFRRCWFVVWNLRNPREPRTQIYAPSLMVRILREGLEPVETPLLPDDPPLRGMLKRLDYGKYLDVAGVDHEAVVDLIKITHRQGWSSAEAPGR